MLSSIASSRPRSKLVRLDPDASAGDDVDDHHDDRKDQQKVNQPAADVQEKAEQPECEEHDDDGP